MSPHPRHFTMISLLVFTWVTLTGRSPAFAEDKTAGPPKKDAPAKKEAPKEAPKVKDVDTGDSSADAVDAAKSPAAPSDSSPVTAPVYKAGNFWVLDFDAKKLSMIAPREGLGVGHVYWYLVYTLSNPSKEDRSVFVSVTANTDSKKQYSDLYLPSVELAIEKKEKEPLWGKTNEVEVLSKRKTSDPKYNYLTLKAGESRKCVAVFNAIDPNASKIVIGVAGLSNEIRTVKKDDGTSELEHRVRELYYERPGDEYQITADSFKLVGREWVKKRVALPSVKPKAAK